MIKNFEDVTQELTDFELHVIAPRILLGLQRRVGKVNTISNRLICDKLLGEGIKTKEPRIRKVINHLVTTRQIERLVATSKGYYIATTKDECIEYALSLKQRINAITKRYEAIMKDIQLFDSSLYP